MIYFCYQSLVVLHLRYCEDGIETLIGSPLPTPPTRLCYLHRSVYQRQRQRFPLYPHPNTVPMRRLAGALPPYVCALILEHHTNAVCLALPIPLIRTPSQCYKIGASRYTLIRTPSNAVCLALPTTLIETPSSQCCVRCGVASPSRSMLRGGLPHVPYYICLERVLSLIKCCLAWDLVQIANCNALPPHYLYCYFITTNTTTTQL